MQELAVRKGMPMLCSHKTGNRQSEIRRKV